MIYQKNLWEKIGDLLAHPGKRFLLGLLSILFLGPFGVFIALAILESSKTYFVANITVQAPTGEIIPCAIVKQNRYAFIPVVPFVSLFFYIPYKTDYFLLKNVSAPKIQKDTKVNDTLLNAALVRMEQITKAKAVALQNDPQIIAQELFEQAEQARCSFFAEAKPFFDTGLLKEIFGDKHLSFCDLEGMCVLFHYSKLDGNYCGMHINADYIDKIKEDPSFLLETYFNMGPDRLIKALVILDNAVLERLLRIRQQTEEAIDSDSNSKNPESQEVLSRISKNKGVLTKEIIEKNLKKSSATPKKALGIILCLPALGAIELGIAGIVTGGIIMGIIFLALGIWLSYVAIKNIRRGKKNKEHVLQGQYKIIQTTCIGTSKDVREHEDGTTTYYTTKFANGDTKTLQQSLGVTGDTFYLVYLPGSTTADAIFNGIEFIPSSDLTIEVDNSAGTVNSH